MTTRVAAILALLGGALLYVGIALPARRAAAEAEAQTARIEGESVTLRARLAEREARHATEERLRRNVPGARAADGIGALRRALIQSLKGAPVSAVRLSVVPGGGSLGARAHVAAEGSFRDLVSLSNELIGPVGGLVPERLSWAPAGPQLLLELDGVTARRQP